MENATENKPKNTWLKYYGLPLIFLIISVSGLIFDLYLTHKDNRVKDIALAEVNSILIKERADKTSCIYTKDSLIKINASLSVYKTLSLAMLHRDEATSLLKYQVGEAAHLKSDSSRVIVEDIVIGGSKHNYYVTYFVRLRNDTLKKVAPELIY